MLASYEDRLEKSRKNVHVCKDIQTFNFRSSSTLYHFHLYVYGHVTRKNGINHKAYLGWSLSNANLAIPYMKAFIVRKGN